MKELEVSTTVITFDPKPPADAKQGEVAEGEEEPKPQATTTIEVIDMRLDVVLGRRHEHIMNRTLRIRTALTKDDHTHSNSHRITF